MVMPSLHEALDRDAILRALSSFYGITTADGNPAGTTLFCSNLIGKNDFITSKTVLLQSGPSIYEDRGATGFNPLTGQITVNPALSSQVLRGTSFYLLNAMSAALAITLLNAIETKIDNINVNELTTFKQEAVAATDVNGTTWKDLLNKSSLSKTTKICGFMVTVGGIWAGKAQVRITDGAANKIFPFKAQYEQDTDFVSGSQVVFNFPVVAPKANGYKFQFRSTNGADGAGETLQLNNLDVIEMG